MLIMTLLICGAVLCVAITALFTFQILNFRSNFQHETATLAAVLANNSAAAMASKDEVAATEIVASLRADPTVLAACLVLPDNSLFARFGNEVDANALSQFPPAGECRFIRGHLLVTQQVKWKGQPVGTLCLRSDYERTFQELYDFYGLVIVGIIIVSISLAMFLSNRLGREITHPILQLARTAKIVGDKKDYSVRSAVNSRGDELGRLPESFNEMLSRIQSQDAALSCSQQKMEALINSIDGIVWERTPERTQFTFISQQSKNILGYEPEAWLDTPHFWEGKLQPQDAA